LLSQQTETSYFVINYGFSILFFNVYIYILILYFLFNIFFLFKSNKFISLNTLKGVSGYNYINNTILLILVSMAGIPPLLGFFGKFLAFNFLFYKNNVILIIIFSFMNFFSIYFYIQNIKFLKKKNFKNFFFLKKNKILLNKIILNKLTLLNYINIFGIGYINIILLFFLNLNLNIFF